MNKQPIRLILSDIRSAGNVGSMLRTADAAGLERICVCGYTPYPRLPQDDRPPHIIANNTRTIAKTALGAEATMPIEHYTSALDAIYQARTEGFSIIVMEQAESSLNLYQYEPTTPLAIVMGNEVTGTTPEELTAADTILEIPMLGTKESLNVSVAAAIAIYQLRFGRHV